LAVLGAAVGALLGVVLLRLFPGDSSFWLQLLIVLGLAVAGFFAAAFARGIIDVVILVIGALAGAEIVLALLDLLRLDLGVLQWVLAVIGAVIGFMLIRRSRKSSRDWGMIILTGLIGALLVTRGLTQLFPSLQSTAIATLLVVVLAGGSMAYQGGILGRRKAGPATQVSASASGDNQPPPAN
jgi:hypothetical protein